MNQWNFSKPVDAVVYLFDHSYSVTSNKFNVRNHVLYTDNHFMLARQFVGENYETKKVYFDKENIRYPNFRWVGLFLIQLNKVNEGVDATLTFVPTLFDGSMDATLNHSIILRSKVIKIASNIENEAFVSTAIKNMDTINFMRDQIDSLRCIKTIPAKIYDYLLENRIIKQLPSGGTLTFNSDNIDGYYLGTRTIVNFYDAVNLEPNFIHKDSQLYTSSQFNRTFRNGTFKHRKLTNKSDLANTIYQFQIPEIYRTTKYLEYKNNDSKRVITARR